MEASTTIGQMFANNKIFVPSYQRAYSWDTESEKGKAPKHTNVFLMDLENHYNSSAKSRYYFGHFLLEKKEDNRFGVIDGQQRMTTIIIFLSALFSRLKLIRNLKENEQEIFGNIIISYNFKTVAYDNQFFKDYVIDQNQKDNKMFETESAKRIAMAFDYFKSQLADKDEEYLLNMLDTIKNASCTTHLVEDESEAIQMFIFQNNRGKKPSNLEIIKAQFMFKVHLYGGNKKEILLDEIKERFEKIYRSISSIESKIYEDDILVYTLRVYFNSLSESNALDRINEQLLSTSDPIPFIQEFTRSLAKSFEFLKRFFGEDEENYFEIHSLITLGGIGIAIPFIIKSYEFNLPMDQIKKLCNKLETMVLRHRLIGTRADITLRLKDVYKEFKSENKDIKPIIELIEKMKTTMSPNNWWLAYWNKTELERSIQGRINHSTARYLLWKYENHLEGQGKNGYEATRFDRIKEPHLEHIAPQTEKPEAGYDSYDEEFINQYIDCLGNYLLLSKSHNCSLGNKPFVEKRNSYKHSEQQREIQNMTSSDNPIWKKELIQKRKEKIIKFIIENL